MKIPALRAIDRFVGVPCCALLTLHRKAFGWLRHRRDVRRVLFVKLAEQGSTVIAAEALKAAVERFGKDNVFFLAFKENRFILDAMHIVPPGNVLTVDVRTVARALRSIALLVPRLRSIRADASIDLEFFARSSAICSYLSGAPLRVGLHSFAGEGPYRGDLMTHRVLFNAYLHTSELFLLLVDAVSAPEGRFPAFDTKRPQTTGWLPVYEPRQEDLDAVRAMLGGSAAPVVLLNANCSDMLPLRRWDRNNYIELARRIIRARPELRVVLTGAPEEAGAVEALAADIGSPRCMSLAGKTTFPQLLALYSLSEVMVTNDSGPAHFAALTPIDVVTLFGPETPLLFAPRTPRSHVVWAATPCSPCVSAFNNRLSKCRDNVCMKRIGVDEVLDVTLKAYNARKTAMAG